MAFRRRFNRFRRFSRARRPRSRTTWIPGWDFAVDQNMNGSSPCTFMGGIPTSNDPRAYALQIGSGSNVAQVLQSNPFNPTSPYWTELVSGADLSEFEGNATVVRVMGHLRLHAAGVIHDPGTAGVVVHQVEVRAHIYQTTEQEFNGITALVNPFNQDDKDTRILWSASWVSKLTLWDPTAIAQEAPDVNSDEDFMLNQFPLANWPDPARSERVRRVNIKAPIKLRGNQRLAMSVSMYPCLVTSTEIWGVRMSGWGRVLLKH